MALSSGDAMDFTLKFAGELPSQQARAQKNAKHAMRLRFHEQLAMLWAQHAWLKQYDPASLQIASSHGAYHDVPRPVDGRGLLFRAPLGPFHFVPLVNRIHLVHCHLAIRLHRPLERGGIIYDGGDVDNRLKILFDGLRMPKELKELPDDGQATSAEPRIFHCLLEDDALITKVSVESFMLLKVPNPTSANYAEMDIDVHIEPVAPIMANLPVLFP